MDSQFNEWLKEAKGWAEGAFAIYELFGIASEFTVEFNNRFTARAGDAHYGKRLIRLSAPLWPRMTEQDRYETVIHEAAHIIVRALYHRGVFHRLPKAHGWEWRSVMFKLRVSPERCHSIDISDLERRHPRYDAICNCRVHKITMCKVRGIMAGRNRICLICKSILTLPNETVAACNQKR